MQRASQSEALAHGPAKSPMGLDRRRPQCQVKRCLRRTLLALDLTFPDGETSTHSVSSLCGVSSFRGENDSTGTTKTRKQSATRLGADWSVLSFVRAVGDATCERAIGLPRLIVDVAAAQVARPARKLRLTTRTQGRGSGVASPLFKLPQSPWDHTC